MSCTEPALLIFLFSYKKIPMKRRIMALKMKKVNLNFSGNRKLQRRAVTMLAVAPVYSFTMLSSFLRMEATTRPPILLNTKARTNKMMTPADTCCREMKA